MGTQSLPDSTNTIPNSVYGLVRHINQLEHPQQVLEVLIEILQHSKQGNRDAFSDMKQILLAQEKARAAHDERTARAGQKGGAIAS